METKIEVECKGIKEKDDVYTVMFNVVVGTMDAAVKLRKEIKDNLANNLQKQTVLK